MALHKLLATGICLATMVNVLAVTQYARDNEPVSPIVDPGYSKYRGVRLSGGGGSVPGDGICARASR